jgi:hypothetical protein
MKRFIQFILLGIVCTSAAFAQQTQGWQLKKMPADLETDYALSSLPPRLRNNATVYLLDPTKGYYISRKGTNGFSVFINRTQWEQAEFLPDVYTSISYDEEGAKIYLPVYFDVAAMRASGKYSPEQIRDAIVQRVKDGTYKAPSRTGISYMLCPINRGRVGEMGIINEVMPHYMFYAPGVDNDDIGGAWITGGHQPFAINSGDNVLDKRHSIFNYIIIAAGEAEKAKIMDENKELLSRLATYQPYFKVEMGVAEQEHHH